MENDGSIEKLELSIVDSVSSEKLIELSGDLGESFLDVIMEEGIAQNIPVFGTIYKIGKAGLGIREQYFAKKVYTFLLGIKDIPADERQGFIEELEDQDFQQRAGETLTTLLDRYDNLEKPKILANLLKAKIAGEINIVAFLRLASVVEKAFVPDIKKLPGYIKSQPYLSHETESLRSLGLIYQSVLDGGGRNNRFSITSLGEDLLNHGLHNILNT